MIGNNFKITRNDDVTSYWMTKFSSFTYESILVEFNTVLRIGLGNKIATFFREKVANYACHLFF